MEKRSARLMVLVLRPRCQHLFFSGLPRLGRRGKEELRGYWPSLTRTQRRGQFFFVFFFLLQFLSHSVCIHFTRSQVAKDLNLLQPVLKSFLCINFKRERGYILHVNAFEAWQSDILLRDKLHVLNTGIIICFYK